MIDGCSFEHMCMQGMAWDSGAFPAGENTVVSDMWGSHSLYLTKIRVDSICVGSAVQTRKDSRGWDDHYTGSGLLH